MADIKRRNPYLPSRTGALGYSTMHRRWHLRTNCSRAVVATGDFGPTGEYRGFPSSTAAETTRRGGVNLPACQKGFYREGREVVTLSSLPDHPPDRLFE